MPKYVYQNLNTGEHHEVEQSFHDEAFTHHPETGDPVKRVIFAPAVVFKGSGWYVKDSKSGGASGGSKSEPKAESSGDSKTESKTEAKPESSKPESGKTETSAAAD